MNYPITVLKSKRKTLSLSVEKDLTVLVKAPLSMRDGEIQFFLEKHRHWIENHICLRREQSEKAKRFEFTQEQVSALKKRAQAILLDRVAYYSSVMGVRPVSVGITSAKTRWGSCSGKNRLNFTYRLILLPPEAVDYVVVHELAHIRVKNHSARFYAEVAKYLPDYRKRISALKEAQRNLGL